MSLIKGAFDHFFSPPNVVFPGLLIFRTFLIAGAIVLEGPYQIYMKRKSDINIIRGKCDRDFIENKSVYKFDDKIVCTYCINNCFQNISNFENIIYNKWGYCHCEKCNLKWDTV